jgi:hypothetical protein
MLGRVMSKFICMGCGNEGSDAARLCFGAGSSVQVVGGVCSQSLSSSCRPIRTFCNYTSTCSSTATPLELQTPILCRTCATLPTSEARTNLKNQFAARAHERITLRLYPRRKPPCCACCRPHSAFRVSLDEKMVSLAVPHPLASLASDHHNLQQPLPHDDWGINAHVDNCVGDYLFRLWQPGSGVIVIEVARSKCT